MLSLSSLLFALLCNQAQAGPIIGAVDATVNEGGPGIGDIANTYNMQGMRADALYTSGVTDFEEYISSLPYATYPDEGAEWFSESGVSRIRVTYDLGVEAVIDAVAFWNEDLVGVGSLDLYTSIDNSIFTPLALGQGLIPTDHETGEIQMLPDVFNFAATQARYVQIVGSACPGLSAFSFTGCSLAEIAFSSVVPPNPDDAVTVDEPLPLILMGLGILGLALRRRPGALDT